MIKEEKLIVISKSEVAENYEDNDNARIIQSTKLSNEDVLERALRPQFRRGALNLGPHLSHRLERG